MLRKILLVAALVCLPAPALAKAVHESPYTYEQTFGSTLRLLKVDLEMEVTEVNADWGYVLFLYTDSESGKRKNRASFSFVREDGKVTVTLQVPAMPSYHEQHILEKLRRKLEDEHGEPPVPQKKPSRKDGKKGGEKDGEKDGAEKDGEGEKEPEKKPADQSRSGVTSSAGSSSCSRMCVTSEPLSCQRRSSCGS
jgi:hypothetical protein